MKDEAKKKIKACGFRYQHIADKIGVDKYTFSFYMNKPEIDPSRETAKKLIEVVGQGGGFILSSGCSIPANAKTQNVKAMHEAVEEYGHY